MENYKYDNSNTLSRQKATQQTNRKAAKLGECDKNIILMVQKYVREWEHTSISDDYQEVNEKVTGRV